MLGKIGAELVNFWLKTSDFVPCDDKAALKALRGVELAVLNDDRCAVHMRADGEYASVVTFPSKKDAVDAVLDPDHLAGLRAVFQLLRDAHAAAERQKLQDAEKQELQRRDAAEAVAAERARKLANKQRRQAVEQQQKEAEARYQTGFGCLPETDPEWDYHESAATHTTSGISSEGWFDAVQFEEDEEEEEQQRQLEADSSDSDDGSEADEEEIEEENDEENE